MAFQSHHRLAGHAAAAASPNTPAHLRQHQARLAQGGTMAKGKVLPKVASKKIPSQATMGNDEYRQPEDTQPFTDNVDSLTMPQPGVQRSEPRPAGSRPMSVSANLPRQGMPQKRGPGSVVQKGQKGPGIRKSVAGKNLKWQRKGGNPGYGGAFYGF